MDGGKVELIIDSKGHQGEREAVGLTDEADEVYYFDIDHHHIYECYSVEEVDSSGEHWDNIIEGG